MILGFATDVPMIWAANYSLGVNLLLNLEALDLPHALVLADKADTCATLGASAPVTVRAKHTRFTRGAGAHAIRNTRRRGVPLGRARGGQRGREKERRRGPDARRRGH